MHGFENGETDRALRPDSFAAFIGQETLLKHLTVYVEAARARNDALDHVLFHGPPGLGKTTLSRIIAAELGSEIIMTTAPALERTGDLAAILTGLSDRDVLFIDEIHRLRAPVEETLYSAMEDYAIDIVLGQGAGAKTVRLTLPHFTLIGATTRTGMLSGPFFARFGIVNRIDYYDYAALEKIVARNAVLLGLALAGDGAAELARRVRGTPRICNNLLRRLRDFAEVGGETRLDRGFVDRTLAQLGIDALGLDEMDRRYLSLMIANFDGGPVGVETMAVSLGEDKETLSDVYEPFLIQQGFVKRTPRGRVALDAAYRHLGMPVPSRPALQDELF
jgi:Holliday junction DNA helicase RuvB